MLRTGGFCLALPLLAIFWPLVSAQAQQTADAGVITIESDLQSADNGTGVITASGNVRLVHAGRGLVATSRQAQYFTCLLYTSPSPRDGLLSRMPSSA